MGTPHKHEELIKANIHRFVCQSEGVIVWADKYGPRTKKGGRIGLMDSHGYLQVGIGGRSVLVHRIIWMMFNDDYPEQIDHIDRVRTNNKIENLRAATNGINQQNASTRKDNTSGMVGVNFKNGKWQARIAINKKRIHLGCFESFNEAKLAYQKAKKEHHPFSVNHE